MKDKYEDTVFDDGTEPTVRQVPERRLPYGCDQQGRYPQAVEPCTDLDELGVKLPPQEPWWPYMLGAVVGLLALVLVFGGVLK
jgi:hypothetical protein